MIQRTLLIGHGIYLINEIKRIEKKNKTKQNKKKKKQEHTWTQTHDLLVVNYKP